MQLTVNLDAYSGPLDLLLDLISKQKVDIYDIEISKITKHYLEAIENSVYSEDTDISAFLLMSSTLVEIKSRSLIPKNTDEDEDEIVTKEQLVERLIEYRKFKKVGEYFKKLEIEGSKAYSKMQSDITEYMTEDKEIILNTDVDVLLSLMENIINQYRNKSDEDSFEKIIENNSLSDDDFFELLKFIHLKNIPEIRTSLDNNDFIVLENENYYVEEKDIIKSYLEDIKEKYSEYNETENKKN